MVSAGPSPRARRAARRPRHRGAGPATILAGRKEQRQSVSSDRALSEPSPQARGAGPGPGRLDHLAETIPAGAGSSGPRCRWRCPSWDHPRGREEQTGRRSAGPWRRDHPCQCEEQNMDRRAMKASRGPSPPARGEQSRNRWTPRPPQPLLHVQEATGTSSGTSPNRRGPLRGHGEQPDGEGYDGRAVPGTIPAGTGSRGGSGPVPSRTWDHHRGRGEQAG